MEFAGIINLNGWPAGSRPTKCPGTAANLPFPGSPHLSHLPQKPTYSAENYLQASITYRLIQQNRSDPALRIINAQSTQKNILPRRGFYKARDSLLGAIIRYCCSLGIGLM